MGLLWDLTLSSHTRPCGAVKGMRKITRQHLPSSCDEVHALHQTILGKAWGMSDKNILLQDHSLHIYLASKYSSVIGSPLQPLSHQKKIQHVWVGGRATNFINFQREGEERAEDLSLTNLLCNPLLLFQYIYILFFIFTSLVFQRTQTEFRHFQGFRGVSAMKIGAVLPMGA